MLTQMNLPLSYTADLSNLFSLQFKYSRADGSYDVTPVSLLPDGSLLGHSHKNEAAWKVLDGKIAFVTRDGRPSTIFDECEVINGKVLLKGRFLLRAEPAIYHHLEQVDWSFSTRDRHSKLTARHFAEDIERFGWTIGDHTYGYPNVIEKPYAKLHIGKYCSIAGGVLIALGNHKVDGVTSYPFASLPKYWPSMRGSGIIDHTSKGDVTIGNDVWLGYGVTILPGVTIGDGAIIGAEALVSKDVPPYAIVGGNPGRVLKYRLSPEDIEALQSIQWWDWPDEVLNDRLPLMMTDLRGFIDKYR
jgi:acetyltransferase-like isoleucine patch superfamily enzyme